MTDELTAEELLWALEKTEINPQAKAQLRKLIELTGGSPSEVRDTIQELNTVSKLIEPQKESEGVDEELEFLDAVGLALEYVNWKYYVRKATVLLRIKQLLTRPQKRTVTKEKAMRLAKYVAIQSSAWWIENDTVEAGYEFHEARALNDITLALSRELGIEVVDK